MESAAPAAAAAAPGQQQPQQGPEQQGPEQEAGTRAGAEAGSAASPDPLWAGLHAQAEAIGAELLSKPCARDPRAYRALVQAAAALADGWGAAGAGAPGDGAAAEALLARLMAR